MQVRLDISPDTDVEIEEDSAGNPIAIIFRPMFAARTSGTVLAYGVSKTDADKVVDRFSLVVSGANGTVKKKSRTGSVKAAVDATDEETKGK